MERVCGKQSVPFDAAMLAARLTGYDSVAVDLGTGDGRYVRRVARACPAQFVIGIDTCREMMREESRIAPPNALFLIADALALPCALDGLATTVTINFPWGSLLRGLLDAESPVLPGLRRLTRPGATVDVHLNAGALAEAGHALAMGSDRLNDGLRRHGFVVRRRTVLDAAALRAVPTSWARRLAFGREPRAIWLQAQRR